MRLRVERRLTGWVLAGLAAGAVAAAPPAAAPSQPSGATEIDAAQISAAVDEVRKDLNLGGIKHVRTLRWVDQPQSSPKSPPRWIVTLFAFFARTGGLLMWVAGAIMAAIAILWMAKLARAKSPPAVAEAAGVSQVQNLDIRPASLPDDVGGAARELLTAGRVREALSLLYRGALSRAVHRRGVAIGAAFTEGEVLAAVGHSLDEPATRYFNDLVGVWRLVVYAGAAVPAEEVQPLCERFGAVFEAAPP